MPKPKLPDNKRRDIRLVLRITPTEAKILMKAAERRGLDIAKFVRMAIGKELNSAAQRNTLNRLPNDFPDVI